MAGFLVSSPGTMNPTKRLTGVCSECGGSIQFPAELIGTMTQCPRCRKQTELTLAELPEEATVPRKVIVWTVVAVAVLVLALIVTVVGLRHLEKLAAQQKQGAAAGFQVSAFALEKGQGGNGTYAVGTVVNTTNRPRSQVTLELYLLDAGGHTSQVLRAFRPVLEPGAKWEIRLPVAGNSKAISAKMASIKEGQ